MTQTSSESRDRLFTVRAGLAGALAASTIVLIIATVAMTPTQSPARTALMGSLAAVLGSMSALLAAMSRRERA